MEVSIMKKKVKAKKNAVPSRMAFFDPETVVASTHQITLQFPTGPNVAITEDYIRIMVTPSAASTIMNEIENAIRSSEVYQELMQAITDVEDHAQRIVDLVSDIQSINADDDAVDEFRNEVEDSIHDLQSAIDKL
jgi:ABC-type multidrug transport system fused ATPase/permease subunit